MWDMRRMYQKDLISNYNMEPIDIVVLTCNRIELLKKTISYMEDRISIPYRLIVINNNSKDGTTEYLEKLKNSSTGLLDTQIEIIHNKDGEEQGICGAYNQSIDLVESELFIATQDDLLVPDLEPCVVTQLIDLFNRNSDYGAICLRTVDQKRGPRGDDELIRPVAACPGVFRIQRLSDIKRSAEGFGHARRWEDTDMVRVMTNLGKKCAIASNLWIRDVGLEADRGYPSWYRERVVGNYNKNFEWVRKDRPQRNVGKVDLKTHEPI